MVVMDRKGIFSRLSWLAIALLAASSSLIVASANELEPVEDKILILFPYHALLVLSGLLFLIAGMVCARYLKGKRWWLKAHKTLGIAGAALTLSGITVAIHMVSASAGLQPPGGPQKAAPNSQMVRPDDHCSYDDQRLPWLDDRPVILKAIMFGILFEGDS
ncbi:hypothetical protein [Methanothrix sp.]|uniref:hypothetical protein n=1 Tax=Methanothrix sp. TaxID=90426 RepID=UPI0032994313